MPAVTPPPPSPIQGATVMVDLNNHRLSDEDWISLIKDRMDREDALEMPKHTVPKLSLQWCDLWTFVPLVLLLVSTLRGLEASLIWRIVLISTCGESFTLLTHIRLRHSITQQQPDRWALIAQASLYVLKSTFTGVFCVGWMADGDPTIFVLLPISAIYALQILFCQIHLHHSKAQASMHNSCTTWRGMQDVEKALDPHKVALAGFNGEFDCELYTLVRLCDVGSHESEEISVKLDQVGRLHEIASVLELPDESWEMVVLKSYLAELESRLGKIFPGCHVHPDYDPTEPNRDDMEQVYVATRNLSQSGVMDALMVAEDIKRFYIAVKVLKIHASSSRAMTMIEEAWPIAAAYYSCLLERNTTWLEENVPVQ